MSFDASYYYTADDTFTRREANELFERVIRSALDGDSASVDHTIEAMRSRGIPIDLVLQTPALTPCKLSGQDPTLMDVAVELGLSDLVHQVVRAGAILNNKSEYLRRVFGTQPVQGYVLELAALRQDIQMVSMLIELGADARRGAPVAAAMPKGYYSAGKHADSTPETQSVSATALQAVARCRALRSSAAGYKATAGVNILDAALVVMKLLLDAGADPNAKGRDDSPPLHACTAEAHEPLARLLLAHGASARASNSRGWTAAHYVCSQLHQSRATDGARILQLLADHGADFGAVTETGKTPFDYLTGQHHELCSPTVVALLLRSQQVLVSAPKAGLRDCRERVASCLQQMIGKERDAGKPLRCVGVIRVVMANDHKRTPEKEYEDLKERVEFEMQVRKDLVIGTSAKTRGGSSRAASEASGSATDGEGASSDSGSPPAPGSVAAGVGDVQDDAIRNRLESELRARAFAEKEKEKEIEERLVTGWASGGAVAASTRCCSALHKALMQVEARGAAVTAAVLRCLEEHLPWSGVTSGWRLGMALATSPRHRAVVRWRHAGRALQDRGLAWAAASEGRPMELARRLRLGKLAGALVARGMVGGAGGDMTALEAARLGGHEECVKLLEEAMG